tara:strand:+ start:2035 stop:2829 length:795 start_codon:yes stop_codon:yes gene_type:complete
MKKGRLSKQEHKFIEENWKTLTLGEICIELDRDAGGVNDYIKKLSKMEQKGLDEHELEQVEFLRNSGHSLQKALEIIGANIEYTQGTKHILFDFEKIQNLSDTLNVVIDDVSELSQSINEHILDWRDRAEKEAVDKVKAIEANCSFNVAVQQRALADKFNMPSPPPPICSLKGAAEHNLQGKSGIYFGWDNLGNIVYVGRAQDLKQRVKKGHHKLTEDHLVSWIEFEKSKIYSYELFYIWLCEPILNGEIVSAKNAFIQEGEEE